MINRGNYRRNLFSEKGGAEAFERVLGEAATKYGWRVHAYVVMRNHFHLALELSEPNLSRGMQWLQGTWVRRVNLFRKLTGRPFQDRYKALVVQPGAVFSNVCDYVQLNPVRAGAVVAEELIQYPWSSLPKWTKKDRPQWLDPSTALGERGGLSDDATGWRRYHAALVKAAVVVAQTGRPKRGELSRGWCLGSAAFRADLKQRMLEKGMTLDIERLSGLEATEVKKERALCWEQRLVLFATKAKIRLGELSSQKSDPAKTLLAAAMKETTSATNQWLAERLGMGEPASASQFVRRRMLNKEGAEEVRALMSRVKL